MSANSFGQPDWLLSSVVALTSQEDQHIMDIISSNRDLEGYKFMLWEILLLNPSRISDRCTFSLHSPILPWSSSSCLLELAVYSQGLSLAGLSAEVHDVDTNQSKAVHLQEGHEEDAWVKWKILIGSIGQMERPFEITLIYSSCDEKNSGFLALGSLQLQNCLHDKDLFNFDKGSPIPCPHEGCVSHLAVCSFNSDCPNKEEDEPLCDSLTEGAHCSFEEGACGWTIDGNINSSWSISGFSRTHENQIGRSALQATEGIFLILHLLF
ncbi:hypothetical protein E2320_021249 [Naja naja]|nr:hypothetical protein E2320_021249 [Naja naja]